MIKKIGGTINRKTMIKIKMVVLEQKCKIVKRAINKILGYNRKISNAKL